MFELRLLIARQTGESKRKMTVRSRSLPAARATCQGMPKRANGTVPLRVRTWSLLLRHTDRPFVGCDGVPGTADTLTVGASWRHTGRPPVIRSPVPSGRVTPPGNAEGAARPVGHQLAELGLRGGGQLARRRPRAVSAGAAAALATSGALRQGILIVDPRSTVTARDGRPRRRTRHGVRAGERAVSGAERSSSPSPQSPRSPRSPRSPSTVRARHATLWRFVRKYETGRARHRAGQTADRPESLVRGNRPAPGRGPARQAP